MIVNTNRKTYSWNVFIYAWVIKHHSFVVSIKKTGFLILCTRLNVNVEWCHIFIDANYPSCILSKKEILASSISNFEKQGLIFCVCLSIYYWRLLIDEHCFLGSSLVTFGKYGLKLIAFGIDVIWRKSFTDRKTTQWQESLGFDLTIWSLHSSINKIFVKWLVIVLT